VLAWRLVCLCVRCLLHALIKRRGGCTQASADGTARAMMYLLIILGLLPEEQEKLRSEVQQAMAGHEGPLTPELLARMPYLEVSVKESARLMPSQHLMPRTAVRDLEFAGYHIPAGACRGVALPQRQHTWRPASTTRPVGDLSLAIVPDVLPPAHPQGRP
jgi:hypothetical protein